MLVIGRSGTGKTTTAILRMFSMQILFKIRVALANKRNENLLINTNVEAEDITKTMGIHTVFCTASPILTNEI